MEGESIGREPRTRAVAFGGAAAFVGMLCALLLLGDQRYSAVRILIIVFSAVSITEGIALLVNWRGGTEVVVAIVGRRVRHGDQTFIALYGAKMWFMRCVVAPLFVILGAGIVIAVVH